MAEKKAFLLRIDAALWAEIERLAQAELRSANAQVEFLLRDALAPARRHAKEEPAGRGKRTGRLKPVSFGPENRGQELPARDNFLEHRRVRHRIRVPFDVPAAVDQRLAATVSAHANRTTGSCVPCAMKIGMSRFAGAASVARPGRVDQVGRQRDDAGQPLGVPQAGVQRDRAALRESGRARCAAPARRAPLRARSALRRAPATCARRPDPRAN